MSSAGPVKAYVLDILDFTDWAGKYLEPLQSFRDLLIRVRDILPLVLLNIMALVRLYVEFQVLCLCGRCINHRLILL